MDLASELLEKINSRKAVVGIIGLGYVGQALLKEIVSAGYSVIGFDKSNEKISVVNKKYKNNFFATTEKTLLKKCDIILICVQTPVDKFNKPDLKYLLQAVHDIAQYIGPGRLIVTESSLAPGTTRNVVLPILNAANLYEEKDLFLATSPERVDPGNKSFGINDIPKLVAGIGNNSKKLVTSFYKSIVRVVIPLSNLEVAEFTKIFENTFRFINIGLVMEMREYTNSLNIDIYEAIDAASTKPFGFLQHYPGPGIGGHCIPVDPFYIFEDAKHNGINLRMIELAGSINDDSINKIVSKAYKILDLHDFNENLMPTFSASEGVFAHANQHNGTLSIMNMGVKGGRNKHVTKKNNILLLGIAYKADVDDIRESPAVKVWDKLANDGNRISYHDPLIPSFNDASSVDLKESVLQQDLIILMTDHSNIDYNTLVLSGIPILDTRHVYSPKAYSNVFHL